MNTYSNCVFITSAASPTPAPVSMATPTPVPVPEVVVYHSDASNNPMWNQLANGKMFNPVTPYQMRVHKFRTGQKVKMSLNNDRLIPMEIVKIVPYSTAVTIFGDYLRRSDTDYSEVLVLKAY
jgi:hypothetical protein